MDKQSRKKRLEQYKQLPVKGGVAAIKNCVTGKMLLISAADLRGIRNRFEFSQNMGGCMHLQLQADWNEYGAKAFSFEVLEELDKKDTQTSKEFAEDIKTLEALWREKLDTANLY